MRRPAGMVLIGILASCACQGDVTIVMAPARGCDSACGVADMSCVTSIGFTTVDSGRSAVERRCVSIEPGSMRSLCDHDLDRLIELDLPADLGAVEVHGFASSLGCGYTTVFGGQARWEGQARMEIPATCSLDCKGLAQRTYRLRLIDLEHFLATQECAPPAAIEDFDVAVGVTWDLRQMSSTASLAVGFEPFYDVRATSLPDAEGIMELGGRGFISAPDDTSCVGADAYHDQTWTTTCFAPAQASLCGDPPELNIVPWVSRTLAVELEALLAVDGPMDWYHVGVVVDAETRAPVAAAVVDGLREGASVRYVDLGGPAPRARTSGGTGASGVFLVVGEMVGRVTVSAPGYRDEPVPIAVTSTNLSSGIVMLGQ